MNFENVSTKKTSSTILNLENLASEYNTILNTYNQIQQELNTFADSQWSLNPYLNTNILFSTGEIAYVTNNGTVMVYENPSSAYSLQQDQQNIATTNSQISMQNQNITNIENTIQSIGAQMSANQTNYNNAIQNAENQYSPLIAEIPIVGLIEYAGYMAEAAIEDTAMLVEEDAELVIDKAAATTQYFNDESVLGVYYQTLNQQTAQLDSDAAILSINGCPPITDNIPIGIPWLESYNNPGVLIPTNPPLLTGYRMPGQIVSEGISCANINATIPPPPYDLVKVDNMVYQGTPIGNIPMENTHTPVELCKAFCYSTPYCSGATYNTSTRICSLSSGAGNMQPLQGNTAIIPKVTKYVLALSQLNLKLTEINDQIMTGIKTGEGEFQKYTNDTKFDNNVLKNRYTKLTKERERIDEIINSIENPNKEEITTDSNYLKYMLLIALAIIIIIFLSNISKSTQMQNADNTFNKSLIFIIILITAVVFGVLFLKTYVTNTPL